MVLEQIFFAFGTLFAIVNPFSTSIIFSKLTKRMSKSESRRVALKASLAAFVALTLFLFIGQPILNFFGVTIYAFRVAGGLYLTWIAFEMLAPKLRRRPENYSKEGDSIAIIPLAIPLLSGPGALTSVLVLGSELNLFIVVLAIFLVCLISWFVLRESFFIQKLLGHTGTNILERIMGIIVLVVAVQFIFNGISGYLLTL